METAHPSASMDLKAQQDLVSAGSEGHQHDSDNHQSESMKAEQDLHDRGSSGSEGHQPDFCIISVATVKVEQDLNPFDSERLEEQLYDAGSMGIKAEPIVYNLPSDELQLDIHEVSMKPESPSVSADVEMQSNWRNPDSEIIQLAPHSGQSDVVKAEQDLHNHGSEGLKPDLGHHGAGALNVEQHLNSILSDRHGQYLHNPGSVGVEVEQDLINQGSHERQQDLLSSVSVKVEQDLQNIKSEELQQDLYN